MGKNFLIIDDSALMRRVISDIIKQSSEYKTLETAANGLEGLDKIVAKPGFYDLIILDINMPKMNGLEMLEALQQNKMKETVVMVSTVAKEGAAETIRALELGAIDFVTKPENFYEVKGEGFKQKILELIDMVAGNSINKNNLNAIPSSLTGIAKPRNVFSVTKSAARTDTSLNRNQASDINRTIKELAGTNRGQKKIVAIACSTGGPKSLQQVIPFLPANLDAGVVLVQHMPKGFTASLADRLNGLSQIKVKEAVNGEPINKGCVYICPGGTHLRVKKEGGTYVIRFDDSPAIGGLRPCANIMYDSLSVTDFDNIVCVVLTGMGADGTAGIKKLAEKKRRIHVISQSAETCVVYGMPKAIAETGLVDEVKPLDKIAESIIKNVGVM